MHVCSSGSSGNEPRVRNHVSMSGVRTSSPRTPPGGVNTPTWRMSKASTTCGEPRRSIGSSSSSGSGLQIDDSVSASGTSGASSWWSGPISSTWNEAAMLKMAVPCWMATTRRVVKLRPSRMRSTS